MSTHPNAILLMILKPDDLSRKTLRNIKEKYGDVNDGITVGNYSYAVQVMENDYDPDGYQISAEEGDIIVFDYLTYGYGEKQSWKEVEKQKNELDSWAKEACKEFNFTYEIYITANYW